MMKTGFGVSENILDLDYNYNTIGFAGANTSLAPCSTSKPVMETKFNNSSMEKNELSEWVERVTKQLIEDFPAETGSESLQTNTTMASDSEDNIVAVLLNELRPKVTTKRVCDDGSDQQLQLCNELDHENKDDGRGLSLMTLLLECAVSISIDNLGEAHRMLLELSQMASPYGPSCGERVVAHFAKAMTSRVINSWLGICSPLINHKSVHGAFQVFNNISPFIKFAHFTSNQAILEAFHGHDRVHIIDLDIMQGLQWPALFHILTNRMEGPPQVRMTGMGTSMEILMETGKQLTSFARRLGMEFEFHQVGKKFGDADISMLNIRRGEALAVHWLQHSLYDANGPDWKTMRLLQQLSPTVITFVEQDITFKGLFLDRFVGSLHYYSTIFDSLGCFLASDDSSRHCVENFLFYTEINNILAIGGPARSGEEKFRQWRSEFAKNGFIQVPMSGNSMAQAQLILNMIPPVHGYSLVQGDGTLRIGWKDTSLYTASSWTSHAVR